MLLLRITGFFLAVLNMIFGIFGKEIPFAEKVSNFRVTSYIIAENVQDKNSLCSEDFDIITNVILFGAASFDENGDVHINEDILSKAVDNLTGVIGERNVIITLNFLGPQNYGNETEYNKQMAYQAELHTKAFESGKLENGIIEVLNKFNLDGVHFDYEYPITNKAWKPFNKFLTELKEQIPDKKLGVAVSDWDMGLSTNALEAVDYIELMLYDNYDSEGRHSTFMTCKEQVRNLALKGLPFNKINFGLPFYARPTDSGAYWYGYNSYYDKLDSESFYYDESIDKTFWFNTPDVIEEKTLYALENGFGGVMIWHYSCDLPSTDSNSLLKAVNTAINT